MSLPTSKEITDLYLYGTATVPDLINESIIRESALASAVSVSVDVKEFMTSGGGRFATGDQFQLVSTFFAGSGFDGLQAGESLSKADYAARLGLTSYGLNVYQRNVDDGAGDYAERVYIWNSLQYKISDNAIFKVNLDGTRVIENFGIQPVTNDNFDFASSDAGFADNILNSWIDPWGIGRQVSLNFTGSVDVQVYDATDYIADSNISQSWTQPSYTTLFESMAEIANNLWDGGDTRFLDDDSRVIKYGTKGDDVIHAAFEQAWLTTIAENGFGTGAVGAGRLEAFEEFGFHLIAGRGNDTIYGSAAGDYLDAGDGNDIIVTVADGAAADNANDLVFAAGGEDNVTVGGGSDLISLGSGDDEVHLVKPESESGPVTAQTVVWGGAGVDSFYFEDGAHVLSINVEGVNDEKLKDLSTSALFNLVNTGEEWPYNYILINVEQQDKIFVDGIQLGSSTVVPDKIDYDGSFEFDYSHTRTGSDGWEYYDAHSMTRVDRHLQDDYYEMAASGGPYPAYLSQEPFEYGLSMGVGDFRLDGFAEGAAGIHFIGDGIWGREETITTVQQITVTSSTTTEYHYWDNTAYIIPNAYTLDGEPEVTPEVLSEGYHIRPEGYEGYTAPTIDLTPFLRVEVGGDSTDNTFTGSVGPQDFQGGSGSDSVDYSGSSASVSVELDIGSGNSGDATDDRYSSIENIIGSDFGDNIYGNTSNNLLIGGAGDDFLGGDDGDDVLQGGAGLDLFTGGDGNDLIDGGNEFDSVILAGENLADYTIFRNADNSVSAISDEGVDTLVDVEEVSLVFEDFYLLEDLAPVLTAANVVNGTSGGESLLGTAANDIVSSLEGNDTIDAGSGSDIVNAGDGDDILIGGLGNDILNGGSGQNQVRYEGSLADYTFSTFGDKTVVRSQLYGIDILTGIQTVFFLGENAGYNLKDLSPISSPDDIVGTNGDDNLFGTAGNDVIVGLAGNDNFDGLLGDDHLYGGIGNDFLNGGEGNDIYHYASGDGNDTISDIAINLDQADVLRFSDLNLGALSFARSGEDLFITVNTTGEVITVETQYFSAGQGWALEKLAFADGTSLDLDHMPDTSWIYGTAASETIDGNFGKDYIFAGKGDDIVNGSAGGDVYFYASGDGSDVFNDDVGFTDALDVIRFTDLDANDLSINRHGDDLELTVAGTGDVITLKGQMNEDQGDWGIDKIEFSDGNSWNRAAIIQHGLNAEDIVTAEGSAGDDTLFGTSAHDLFDGGQGNDYLLGGYGADTYLYSAGDGTDYIDDEANSEYQVDILKFTDLNQSDISAERDGVHLKLTVLSTGDTITLDEEFVSSSEYWGVEKIEFADGTFWDRDDIMSIGETAPNLMAGQVSVSESQQASDDIDRPSADVINFPGSSLEVTISDHSLPSEAGGQNASSSGAFNGDTAEIISLSDFLQASEHSDAASDLWFEPEPIGAVI